MIDRSLFGSEHVEKYVETDGEVGYLWNGAPILILTTTGRNSGEERSTALIFGEDGGNVVIVASKGARDPRCCARAQLDGVSDRRFRRAPATLRTR